MKTELTQLRNESKANVIRNLFQLRIELENQDDERLSRYENEVRCIIERIDHLLQLVIDDPILE